MIGSIDYLTKVKEVDWQFASTNIDDDLHTDYVFLDVSINSIRDYIGINHSKFLVYYKEFKSSFYYSDNENKTVCQFLIEKIKNDYNFCESFVQEAREVIDNLEYYWDQFCFKEIIKTNNTILEVYLGQLTLQKKLYEKTWFMEVLTNKTYGLEIHLRNSLLKYLTLAEIDQVIQYAISGDEISEYSKFENEIVKIALSLKETGVLGFTHPFINIDFNSSQLIKAVCEKYKYLIYHGFNNRNTYSEYDIFQQAFEHCLRNDFSVVKNDCNIDSILQKIDDSELIHLIKVLSKFSPLKSRRRISQLKNFFFLDKLLCEISIKNRIDEYHLRNMIPDEIIKLLNYEIADKELELIFKRKGGFTLYKDNKGTMFYIYSEVNPIKEMKSKKSINGIYRGVSVYKGEIIGKIKKVSRYSNNNEVSNGDVIMCIEGDPDIIPYLRIASAIITEQGGVTCHIAILSRELKIPCIMGVGEVMSKFNDGEKVYVNATEGYFCRRNKT